MSNRIKFCAECNITCVNFFMADISMEIITYEMNVAHNFVYCCDPVCDLFNGL